MTKVAQWKGGKVGKLDLDTAAVGDAVKVRLLREAVRMYEANQRQGTVKTKNRSETAYTGRKPYRQKGTGRARRGDFNSPILRGGGTIFGPRPRRLLATGRAAQGPARGAAFRACSPSCGTTRSRRSSSKPFTEPSTRTALRPPWPRSGAGRSACGGRADRQPEPCGSQLPQHPAGGSRAGIRPECLSTFSPIDWLVLIDDAWTTLLASPRPGRKAEGERGMKNDPYDIIRRPLITEKGTDITTDNNGYTFRGGSSRQQDSGPQAPSRSCST